MIVSIGGATSAGVEELSVFSKARARAMIRSHGYRPRNADANGRNNYDKKSQKVYKIFITIVAINVVLLVA